MVFLIICVSIKVCLFSLKKNKCRERKTYNSVPALIRTTLGIRLAHQVGALFIGHCVAAEVGFTRGNGRSSLQRMVTLQRVGNVLAGSSAQSSHVGVANGLNRRVLLVTVPACEGGVKGPAVVVGWTDGVEAINGVCLGEALAMTTVCCSRLALQHVERAVRHVAGISFHEGWAAGWAVMGVAVFVCWFALGVVVTCAAATVVVQGGVVRPAGVWRSGAGGSVEAVGG